MLPLMTRLTDTTETLVHCLVLGGLSCQVLFSNVLLVRLYGFVGNGFGR